MKASSGHQVRVAKTYRDETKQKYGLLARSQWPSSAVKYRRLHSKLFSAAGARVEFEGLMDVETGGVSGLEDKFVCSFKLAVDVPMGTHMAPSYANLFMGHLEQEFLSSQLNKPCHVTFWTSMSVLTMVVSAPL